jgi:hypothetical protein
MLALGARITAARVMVWMSACGAVTVGEIDVFMRLRLLVALLLLVANPATAGLLDIVHTQTITLPMEYHRLADCAYIALDKFVGAGLKKVDLPGYSQLALESGGTRYWELTMTGTGPAMTRVELGQAQTLFGPMPAKDVMSTVESCAH